MGQFGYREAFRVGVVMLQTFGVEAEVRAVQISHLLFAFWLKAFLCKGWAFAKVLIGMISKVFLA